MSAPVVSVCIPTVHRLSYLKEAVASAQNQTTRNIEILVGDDGDSQALRDWLATAQSDDPRICYLPTPRRLGLAGNWNFLVSHSSGEYCVLMGDDDRLLPTFVERLTRETSPEVAVVFCNHHVIDAHGRRLPEATDAAEERYGRTSLPAGRLVSPATAAWRNSIGMCASIVRTSELLRTEFKEDVNTPEIEMFVRLAQAGAGFAFVPERLAEYRDHAGSETSAGLTLGRLAEHLAKFDVVPELEGEKRACLSKLVTAGVSRNLELGDTAAARRLLELGYPMTDAGRSAFARLCVALPAPLGSVVFRTAARLRRRVTGGERWFTPTDDAAR